MRITLVNPPPVSRSAQHWAEYPVLGLAYIAAVLRQHGHEVIVLDGKMAGLNEDQICDHIMQRPPDLLGFTCMTVEYPVASRIAAVVKAKCTIPIIIGGAHVNGVGARALEESGYFDFACVGEGEYLLLELLEHLGGRRPAGTIAGLIFRQAGRAVANAVRPYPRDYDQLPFPAWDLFHVRERIPMLTHRGCPFRCAFCAHNSGYIPRFRSPANVLAEVGEVIERYRPKVIRFEDETFGLNAAHTAALLQGILERGYHKRVHFHAQTRVDRVEKNFVDLLKQANFDMLELGVESGNAAILDSVSKGITLDQVERAVRTAKAGGLKVWCKFIVGHPHETIRTLRDTARFIARLNPDRLSVAVMTPYPGTEIHAMALRGEGGYRLVRSSWKDYDKYAPGALELDHVSLAALKLHQFLCYAGMYLKNGRFEEAIRLVVRHRTLAAGMAIGLLRQMTRELIAWLAPHTRKRRAAVLQSESQ